ncbi:GGDEF domain-containing protein [Lacisediminimonas profundi]|uniref:GGDEF domain-containing protein n=1 Tax=Lacisediminimonas profundi TaxID=2603856 RepID=UPI00124B382B|nr:GGDEF domain-containing protein [Lacisediminimonas profundi]
MRAVDVMLVSAAGTSIVMLGVLAPLWRGNMPGVREWFAANAVALIAYPLYSIGWKYHPFLLLEMANVAYGATGILIAAGFRRFFGKSALYRPLFYALGALFALLYYFHYMADLPRARVIAVSLFHAGVTFIIYLTIRSAPKVHASGHPLAFARILVLSILAILIVRIGAEVDSVVAGRMGAAIDWDGLGTLFLALGLMLFPALTLAGAILVTSRLVLIARHEAKTDVLTGAWSRRALLEFAERETERADRTGNPLSLLVLDVDDFKRINDSFGHPVGDTILADLVLRGGTVIRAIDYFCRMGGEEFAVLLPDTDADAAARIAQRMRQKWSEARPSNIQYTVSIGVAQHRKGHGWNALYAAADTALRDAKKGGKNRVVVAPDERPAPNPASKAPGKGAT